MRITSWLIKAVGERQGGVDAPFGAAAVAAFDAALRLHSTATWPGALLNRAAARRVLGASLPEALADCDAALARDAGDARALAERGAVLLKLGRSDAALATFRRGVSSRSADPALMRELVAATARCEEAESLVAKRAEALVGRAQKGHAALAVGVD